MAQFAWSVIPPDPSGIREKYIHMMRGSLATQAFLHPNPLAQKLLIDHISRLDDIQNLMSVTWRSVEAFAEFATVANMAWRIVRHAESSPHLRHVLPDNAIIVVDVRKMDQWLPSQR